MLEVRGFRGLTFDTGKVGTQDDVITPPYDVISPEERRNLAARSPYSMVHLILPQDDGGRSRYICAAERMRSWLDEGVLVRDPAPFYYLLRQTFVDLHGNRQIRRGFYGVVRLPEAGERHILGHERTFDKPVEDRLRLTEATQANLGAVFGLYSDPEGALSDFLGEMDRRPPEGTAKTIDGVQQEFWRTAPDEVVTRFFRDKVIYIADGHHRFRTACVYRDAMRAVQKSDTPQPWDFALMGFVAFEDPGLKIYPPHRVVAPPPGFDAEAFLTSLKPWFEVTPVGTSEGLPDLVEATPGECVIGLVLPEKGAYMLSLRDIDRTQLLGTDRGPAWRDLDVAVLHRGLLEGLLGFEEGAEFIYEKNAERALAEAKSENPSLVFILRATRAAQICACAEAGEPMPQKSTYFFPKLPSGVVIHRLL